MGKRKRRESAEPPLLFDLPLRREPGPDDAEPDDAAGGAGERPSEERPGAGGPTILFDEPTGTAGDQLDLVDLGRAAHPEAATAPSAAEPGAGEAGGARPDDAEPDDTALLGDRLLGGLADLAVQLLMLGLAIAAVHSMDVPVTFADWAPFTILAAVLSFLYWIVPLAFWGQTPGMAWVGHTARSLDGEPLTFGQTFRRWLGAVLTLALAGLPLLLALAGRSFTDRLSGSETVCD